MKIATERFGFFEIDEEEIFSFPQGLIGMVGEDRFIFLQQMDQTPFIWMQSIKSPELAFVLTDPWLFHKEYSFTLGQRERSLLELDTDTDTDTDTVPYTLVTVNLSSEEEMTINLKGPLIFNRKKKRGIQMVLEGETYPLQHSIPLTVLQDVSG